MQTMKCVQKECIENAESCLSVDIPCLLCEGVGNVIVRAFFCEHHKKYITIEALLQSDFRVLAINFMRSSGHEADLDKLTIKWLAMDSAEVQLAIQLGEAISGDVSGDTKTHTIH